MNKNFKSILFSLTLLFLSACSGNSANNFPVPEGHQPLFKLTGALATVAEDDLTGTLDVYGTSGKQAKLIHKNLTINDSGVSAPIFYLTRATEYRFVIIFYWKGVAIAYVDTIQNTENDDTTDIRFTEDMIVYANVDLSTLSASESSSLSDDISAGILPDLDADHDENGYSNFIEFRAGTDPEDADDNPTGPSITGFTVTPAGNFLIITATINGHGSVVESSNLSFESSSLGTGNADYLKNTTILTTSLSKPDKNGDQAFYGQLNAGYVPDGELSLTLAATDSIPITSYAYTTVTIDNTSGEHPTTIDFETAESGETLGGTITLSFRAYDDNGIASITVGQPEDLTNTSTASDRFIAEWNTATTPNGTYNFRVTATDSGGNSFTKLFPFTIRNNGKDTTSPEITLSVYSSLNDALSQTNPIDYQNGESVSGLIAISVLATDESSGVLALSLLNTFISNGVLGTPTVAGDSLYINTIDTTQLDASELSNGSLLVRFFSVDGVNNRRKTTFSFTIGNTPTINSFTANGEDEGAVTISAGENVTFTWDAENVTTYTIINTSTNETLVENADASSGSATVSVTESGTYELTLSHTTNNDVTFTTTSDATVTVNVDDDNDGTNNEQDAFPTDNTETTDTDHDGSGDNADPDADNDGVLNVTEVTNGTNPLNSDSDADGVNDLSDAFPTNPAETTDTDHDGVGNNTDVFPTDSMEAVDTDGDGIGNNADLCDANSSTNNTDTDGDLQGDVCDDDADNDGILNTVEVTNGTNPLNTDTDGDGWADNADAFPIDTTEAVDSDSDGVGANTDCNDNNPKIFPNAFETLNGLDDDCDDTTDFFSLSLADTKFTGEGFAELLIASAGDVNSDGYDDILIGTNGNGAYLFYGSTSGISSLNLSNADVKFIVEVTGDNARLSVASAGDVNSDGYDDILIGAPYNDDYGLSSGATYLIYGGSGSNLLSGTISLTSADAKFTGEVAGDLSGWSISSAGDANGDGYDDILIGAYLNDIGGANAGATYLVYGGSGGNLLSGTIPLTSADAKFTGEVAGDYAGVSVARAGDVSGDGYDDILIGASGNDSGGDSAGATYLIYGGSGSNLLNGTIPLAFSDAKFIGEVAGDSGGPISSAGDTNGDGYDDILISACGNDTSGTYNAIGAVYLIYGGNGESLLIGTIPLASSDAKFIGEEPDSETGASSGAGDVDGNGYDDVLIGVGEDNIGYLVLSHFGE